MIAPLFVTHKSRSVFKRFQVSRRMYHIRLVYRVPGTTLDSTHPRAIFKAGFLANGEGVLNTPSDAFSTKYFQRHHFSCVCPPWFGGNPGSEIRPRGCLSHPACYAAPIFKHRFFQGSLRPNSELAGRQAGRQAGRHTAVFSMI